MSEIKKSVVIAKNGCKDLTLSIVLVIIPQNHQTLILITLTNLKMNLIVELDLFTTHYERNSKLF